MGTRVNEASVKFFFPFWFEDQICEGYDPWSEICPDPSDKRFVWELGWSRFPFDGILISRPNLEGKPEWLEKCTRVGVSRALRIPQGISTFGDCGAWSYIDEKEPPYDPIETLDFYAKMRFSLACSVDHIILPQTLRERYRRLAITLRNAGKMKSKWDSDRERYGYELVGVVQGWDPQSYHDSAKEILDMGYRSIALGGQARSPSRTTFNILRRCYDLWRGKKINVHIFGIARKNLLGAYRRFGVTSFDNAYHRRAWMSATNNYEIGDSGYTAIRIPISKRVGEERLPGELRVFDALKGLEDGKLSGKQFLRVLRSYDSRGVGRFLGEYSRTLRDKPWTRCDCPMCKVGIHVCVFRGNQRNMRRGFHNLNNFYNSFKEFEGAKSGNPGRSALESVIF